MACPGLLPFRETDYLPSGSAVGDLLHGKCNRIWSRLSNLVRLALAIGTYWRQYVFYPGGLSRVGKRWAVLSEGCTYSWYAEVYRSVRRAREIGSLGNSLPWRLLGSGKRTGGRMKQLGELWTLDCHTKEMEGRSPAPLGGVSYHGVNHICRTSLCSVGS